MRNKRVTAWEAWETARYPSPEFLRPQNLEEVYTGWLKMAESDTEIRNLAINPNVPITVVPALIAKCRERGISDYQDNASFPLWLLAEPDIEMRGKALAFSQAYKAGARVGKSVSALLAIARNPRVFLPRRDSDGQSNLSRFLAQMMERK